ncbi:MAG TPA: hypothetical protein VMV10_10275 [Pirellulales bacterium]|nr:hypothetical protein [Pirellulales bacterium]
MSKNPLLECAFFIPIRRDANLSDGDLHSEKAWAWLKRELFLHFEGATVAPGFYEGFYKDPDTGEQVTDRSRMYIVAAPSSKVDELRTLLAKACIVFKQKCIYLSVSGDVEFSRGKQDDPP